MGALGEAILHVTSTVQQYYFPQQIMYGDGFAVYVVYACLGLIAPTTGRLMFTAAYSVANTDDYEESLMKIYQRHSTHPSPHRRPGRPTHGVGANPPPTPRR